MVNADPPALTLDARSTAFVIIDLQRGIVARESGPYSPSQVIENAARIGGGAKRQAG